MDAAGTVERGDLLIVDGRIAALGETVPAALLALPEGQVDETYDAAGGWVLPGFVEGHLHLCQTLFRGAAEQSDLLRWLREAIWPFEAAHTESSVAASARLGLCELIGAGVTCVNDMGTVHHTHAIGEAIESAGIRAVFGKALMDQGEGVPEPLIERSGAALDEVRALVKRFHGSGGGRLHVSLAPRFILSCSEELWRDVHDLSIEEGLLIHTHIAESSGEGHEVERAVGRTAARHFATLGLLGQRFVGAHGVWLDSEELAELGRADAALVHCPGSNLKLGSGLASVLSWKDAGIRCGLGSDGAACNNRLDPFAEMSLAAGVSRVRHADRPLSARDVLALATSDGARALGLEAQIGSLEVGKQADVIVVDATRPHHGPTPESDVYAALVHSSRPSDVRLTMVAGRVLFRDQRWITLDPLAVLADAWTEARAIERRVDAEKR
ncbi:MAG TPA: amidohydrolase family protein [Candidatus Limnocylindria bacterium]|nr:amidohydrolase family protein [Candidatus Limnocylindria bacterium]